MVDTIRTLSALQTLLADNTAGDISAQDVRDMLVSVYGAGLTPNAQSPVGSDITGAVGQLYVCTITGLSANRNLTLPSASPGERVGVYIVDGHASNALILKGAASQTINGGSAATEWSRVFIQGECVIFVCVAANTWIVEQDGRIPQHVIMQRSTAQTGIAESTDTEITGYATPTLHIGNFANNTTGRISPRRSGVYFSTCRSRLTSASSAALGDGSVAILEIKVDAASDEQRSDQYSIIGASAFPVVVASAVQKLTIGSYISAFANAVDPTQATTIELGSAAWNYPKLTCLERLST